MSIQTILPRLFSITMVLALMLSYVQPSAVRAQEGDGLQRQVNAESGRVSFISPENGSSIPAARALGKSILPQDPALALAERYAPEFGLQDAGRNLSVMKSSQSKDGQVTVRFQQSYEGIPVLGGELIVNTNDQGDLYSISGEVSPGLSLSTKAAIGPRQAKETALGAMAKWYEKSADDFVTTEPELWIFDESLLQSSTRPAELTWRMEVAAKDGAVPVRELVLVNAQNGGISLHFNQVDTSWKVAASPKAQSLLPLASATFVKYDDLVVDEARNRLYGADKVGNKVDVISMTDLSIISSFNLAYGASPVGLDLSPDGNELAVAQSGLAFVKFIDLTNNTLSENPVALSGTGTKVTDVLYGRAGILYAFSGYGLHVLNLTVMPHVEDASQYVTNDGYYEESSGAISSDKNLLYYVTSAGGSAYNSLSKYNVSTGLSKPTLLKRTHMYGTGGKKGTRLSLINDQTLIVTSGTVYNTATLTPKAKNFQTQMQAVALPGRNFYVTLYDYPSTEDTLNFWDNASSYEVSWLGTGVMGTPGAIAVTQDGNTLFVSSTGGMAKFSIGMTPPGVPFAEFSSAYQYRDLAVDLPRGLVYGTDVSGWLDVIDMVTGEVVKGYLLPNGADAIGIDLSPDGSELAIALNGLEKILFLNPETGATIAEVSPELGDSIYYQNQPYDVIYGKTGRLYSGGNPGSSGIDYVHVIDTTTHTWVAKGGYIRTETEFALNQSQTYLYANQTFSPNNIYIYSVQTDTVNQLYVGPHGSVSAYKFAIAPDGSKIFASSGQVWDSIMQSQLGSLQGSYGELIEYIPNQNMVVMAVYNASGYVLQFFSAADYHLIATYIPPVAGTIHEMEVAPDGSKLIVNINSQILILNLNASVPSAIKVESGSNQKTQTSTTFTLPLKARVTNYLGMPLAGIPVTFTAPASGASAAFDSTGTNVFTTSTDSNGIAVSSPLTANSVLGGYTVKATVMGLVNSASFSLANGSSQSISTYTAGHGTYLPGTFLCNEENLGCTNGYDLHADKAQLYAIGTHDLYLFQHGRNSIDGKGLPIVSSVHYGYGYENAFWNGEQMVYGDGYGFPLADDVVAHELTHGVTQYASNLFYYYQSGAINESFSDLWGEYYDQTNGQGSDTTSVKWQVGEDVTGLWTFRSMSNPPDYSNPDKMTSPYYQMLPYYDWYWDNGGVHTNSGVNNKAVYLMVDGASFNGKTVTGLGWDKVAAIYYEVNTKLLTSGADYSDLYYALQQACTNLIGEHGITLVDCVQVKNAADAVEMNAQPVAKYNPDAALCTLPGSVPHTYFAEDLENGLSKWSFSNGTYGRWQLDTPAGAYAQSGKHALFATDYPVAITDAKATLTSFVVPKNAYLWFAQAYEFEYDVENYDGGVLEYLASGSTTWKDAKLLMDTNGYNGVISSKYTNPLKGRSAFVGSSHGYISTRLNLSTLAGKTVRFRWRMGLDDYGYAVGWAVDNVKLYTCGGSFADVPLNHPYYKDIEILYANNLTGGCSTSPMQFCPDQVMNRAQAAAFMLRGNFGPSYVPPAPQHIFLDDWTKGPWAEAWAEGMRQEGFSAGCLAAPLKYCPWDSIPREQAVIFALKLKYGKDYMAPPASGTVFADMTNPGYYATSWAEEAYKEGIIQSCGTDSASGKPKFCPKNLVSRGLAAYMIVRAKSLSMP